MIYVSIVYIDLFTSVVCYSRHFVSLVFTKMRRCLRIDSCRKVFQSEKNDNNFSNR